MNWIRTNGTEDVDAEIDFAETIPGYKADLKVYNCGEQTFMLVQDFAGNYIYGWPGNDTRKLQK